MALLPEYTWDAKASRYRSEATGRFVARSEVVRQLDKVADASRGNMRDLTQRLIDKQIGVNEWRAAMAHEIKIVHTYSGAAARGGWAQMSPADWGRVGWNIRRQYEYLNNFAAEIASGKQALNGQALTRAQMYGRAGHATFEDMRQRDAELKGLTEERRVLHAQESCPDCISYAALGWQPIGSLPRIGQSQCRTNCRCEFEYR